VALKGSGRSPGECRKRGQIKRAIGRFQHRAERSTYTPRHRPAVCGAATYLNRHARHLVTSLIAGLLVTDLTEIVVFWIAVAGAG
jgi:hypothetical protein